VNWNRSHLLRSCLESLCRQKGVRFDVILVDNGSTDNSLEMVETEFQRPGRLAITVIRNAVNLGFCAANNQGFAATEAEFVALLNNDAEAEAEWLASLLAAFEGRPDIGMAASKILVWEDPSKIDKAGHLIYPDGQNRGRGSGETDRGQYDQVEEVIWPDGCAAMYRREMIRKVGGFDEDFFAYADDAELGLRARIAGWSCLYMPRAVVRHHRGATLGVRSRRRLELIERNRVLLAVKLFPWSLLWLNVMYYGMRVIAGLWAAVRRRGEIGKHRGGAAKVEAMLALLSGDLQAMRLLPRMWRKRRELESIRKLTPSETRELILRFRISLKELTEQAI